MGGRPQPADAHTFFSSQPGDAAFQIVSLYRFNAKFSPRWQPRYLLYGSLPRTALAALWTGGQLPRPSSLWPAARARLAVARA